MLTANNSNFLLFSIFFLALSTSANAQWPVAQLDSMHIITFDTAISGVLNGPYAGQGLQSAPTSGQLDADAWAADKSSVSSATFGQQRTGDYANGISTGGETSNGLYSFQHDTGNSSFGVQPTGSAFSPGQVVLKMKNSTGLPIEQLKIGFDVLVYNNENRSTKVTFSVSEDNSTYSPPGGNLMVASLESADPSPGWTSTTLDTIITGLQVPDGGSYYLRWLFDDAGGTGSRDELAIDNIVITAHSDLPEVPSLEMQSQGPASAEVSWSLPVGYDATVHDVLVFVKDREVIDHQNPSIGPASYTANSTFGAGSPYEEDENAFLVYKGDGSSVNVSGLEVGNQYHVLALITGAGAYSDAVTTTGFATYAYQTGDFRSISDGKWSVIANWETFNGTGWSGAVTAPGAGDKVYIRDSIGTATTAVSVDSLIVNPGGTFTVSSGGNFTANDLVSAEYGAEVWLKDDFKVSSSAGNLRIHDNAELHVEYAFASPATTLWNAQENFFPNSSLVVHQWEETQPLVDGSSISPSNQNGEMALFGNVVLDLENSLSADWTLISGSFSDTLTFNSLLLKSNSSSFDLFLTESGVVTTAIGACLCIDQNAGNLILEMDGYLELAVDSLHMQGGQLGLMGSNNPAASTSLSIADNLVVAGGTFNLSLHSTYNPVPVTVDLSGNLKVANGATFTNTNTSGIDDLAFNFIGSSQKVLAEEPLENIPFYITKQAEVELLHDLTIIGASEVTVDSGGTFNSGYNLTGAAAAVKGSGTFSLNRGGTLIITSPDGIAATGATGAIQTGTRNFDLEAIYHYAGQQPQITGTGLPSTSRGKFVIIDNPTSVEVSSSFSISSGTTLSPLGGKLEVRQGTLLVQNGKEITGSGRLVMSGGTYETKVNSASVPQLSGSYSLSEGTIKLSGSGQELNGGRNYFSLEFAGTDTTTISSSITSINGVVIITSGVLDVEGNSFGGSADLVMTGGVFRRSKLSDPFPEFTGSYSLSGGTVELYGTESDQSQTLRGGITYHNVQIEAQELNADYSSGNITVPSSVNVSGVFRVEAPASVRVAGYTSIDGSGAFALDSGATLLYGHPDGITTTTNDGAVTVAGSRSFNTGAGYALIGGYGQVTGNGLPGTVNRLYLGKSDPTDIVELTNPVTVTDTLVLDQGLLKLGANDLVIAQGGGMLNGGGNSYVWTSGTGSLVRVQDGTGQPNEYAVGTTSYLPFTVTCTTCSGGETFGVRVAEGLSQQPDGSGGPASGNVVEQTWYVETPAGSGQESIDVVAQWNSSDQAPNPGANNSNNTLALGYGATTASSWNQQTPSPAANPSAGIYRQNRSSISLNNGTTYAFGLGDQNSPVPVELVSFTARWQSVGEAALLEWETASEEQNSHFEVERSTDGHRWQQIGSRPGHGTTFQPHQYRFVDDLALQTSCEAIYYRLRQVDFNGESSYSKVVVLKRRSVSEVQLWPNPVRQADVLHLEVEQEGTAKIDLLNVQGQLVQELYHGQLQQGDNQLKLELASVPAGLYFCRITSRDDVRVVQLLVQE